MKRPARRQALSILILLIIAVGAYSFVRATISPVHGRETAVEQELAAKSQRKTPTKSTATLPASTTSDTYYHLNLPPGYRPQATSSTPGLLSQRTLTKASTMGSIIVAIAIKTLPGSGLAADSSYQTRQQNSNYRLTHTVKAGESITLATERATGSIVAFWPHANYLATISVASPNGSTAGSDNTAQQQVLAQVLDGWQWQ